MTPNTNNGNLSPVTEANGQGPSLRTLWTERHRGVPGPATERPEPFAPHRIGRGHARNGATATTTTLNPYYQSHLEVRHVIRVYGLGFRV